LSTPNGIAIGSRTTEGCCTPTSNRSYLQTNNIKDKDKLTLLFQKLIIGPPHHEDIVCAATNFFFKKL
jgi:hypothetical protein